LEKLQQNGFGILCTNTWISPYYQTGEIQKILTGFNLNTGVVEMYGEMTIHETMVSFVDKVFHLKELEKSYVDFIKTFSQKLEETKKLCQEEWFIEGLALFALFVVTKENLRRWIFQTAVSILLLSVTINALVFGNPFHAVTFGILALAALVQLFRRKENIQRTESKWIIVIALAFIFLGLWYPEFVDKNAFMLLAVSPVGVIPCPTLLTTIGLLMLIMPSVNR